MFSFESIFTGILACTLSVCAKSYVRVSADSNNNNFDMPLPLYIINAGLGSTNKSCCISLFKDAYEKMEMFIKCKNVKRKSPKEKS